jgi:hypothetical protein
VKARTLLLVVLALLPTAGPARAEEPDPAAALFLDYQAAEAFRDRLRKSVVLVRVEAEVLPGCDPDFRPIHLGAAALVRLPGDRPPVWLTAAPLVRGAYRVTLLRDAEHGTDARVGRELEAPGVAVLEPARPDALDGFVPLDVDGTPEALDPGRPVFTLDNLASGVEVLLPGRVDQVEDPPLIDLRVVSFTLGAGQPLVDASGRFLGICFRQRTATDPRCFASRAADILAILAPPPEPPPDAVPGTPPAAPAD